MLYDLSEHPLLGAKATVLRDTNEDAFLEQVALAAELLGIGESTFADATLMKIQRQLVLQLNHQLLILENHPEFVFAKSVASSHSKQAITYRDGDLLLFAPALAAVKGIVGSGGWENCKSVRRTFR